MTITEKVAYLKGLAEGMKLSADTDEGKLFRAIIDTLEDLALSVTDAEERLDVLDADLAEVEDIVYDDEDDDFGFDDDDDDGVFEFVCPHCHETVFFDDSIVEDDDDDFELICPACGKKLDATDLLFDSDEDDDETDEDGETD